MFCNLLVAPFVVFVAQNWRVLENSGRRLFWQVPDPLGAPVHGALVEFSVQHHGRQVLTRIWTILGWFGCFMMKWDTDGHTNLNMQCLHTRSYSYNVTISYICLLLFTSRSMFGSWQPISDGFLQRVPDGWIQVVYGLDAAQDTRNDSNRLSRAWFNWKYWDSIGTFGTSDLGFKVMNFQA